MRHLSCYSLSLGLGTVVAILAACGSSAQTGGGEAGSDASTSDGESNDGTTSDTSSSDGPAKDATKDSGTVVGTDASEAAAADSSTTPVADSGLALDAPAESGPEAGPDAGPDSGMAMVEAGVDAAPDAGCAVAQVGICGRGANGIICGLSNGSSQFSVATSWQAALSDANGWSGVSYASALAYPDINGDGDADVCLRGPAGISCGLSNGTTFGPVGAWQPAFSDADDWNLLSTYYLTIQYPDVNGDGKADVCGRGSSGVFCAVSNGATFGAVSDWQASFTDANVWGEPPYGLTVEFPDVDGDGKADVCGRGQVGIYCALSNGTSFGALTSWQASFSDASGWNAAPTYYESIHYPDVNGDGKADVCGRSGTLGIVCALSNGTTFGAAGTWQSSFTDAASWSTASYGSTIQFPDVNGDGKADVCGRGFGGMVCALSNGASFGTANVWEAAFSDAAGWNTAGSSYYGTFQFPDVNRDGKADVCVRGAVDVLCATSTGSTFTNLGSWSFDFTDANGWMTEPYGWQVLDFPTLVGGTCKPSQVATPLLRVSQRMQE